jgi:hypothetical protein
VGVVEVVAGMVQELVGEHVVLRIGPHSIGHPTILANSGQVNETRRQGATAPPEQPGADPVDPDAGKNAT